MREVFLKAVGLLVGNFSLADIWAGFMSASMSSLISLRALFGREYLRIIKLEDVFVWGIGIFIFMRLSMFILPKTGISFFTENKDIDSVLLGAIGGIVNVYLFKKNYKPIITFMNKIFKI